MSAVAIESPPDWMSVAEAMSTLGQAGKLPEAAAAIIWHGLSTGTLTSRASLIRIEFANDTPAELIDTTVPRWIWELCPSPALGQDFWRTGDVRFEPPIPQDPVDVIIGMDDFALRALPPLGQDDPADALFWIDGALGDGTCDSRFFEFRELRYRIRLALGEPEALDDLRKALHLSPDGRQRDRLRDLVTQAETERV